MTRMGTRTPGDASGPKGWGIRSPDWLGESLGWHASQQDSCSGVRCGSECEQGIRGGRSGVSDGAILNFALNLEHDLGRVAQAGAEPGWCGVRRRCGSQARGRAPGPRTRYHTSTPRPAGRPDPAASVRAESHSAFSAPATRSGSMRCGGSKWCRPANTSRRKSGKTPESRSAISP